MSTWREQRAERVRRGRENPELIPHGTNGYVHWVCRCDTCIAANRERQQAQREARKQRASDQPELIPHGRGGYSNWGCRCPVCVTANAEACADRRRRNTPDHYPA